MKKNIRLISVLVIMLISSITYSQPISNLIKNEMVEFLIKEKQYTESDLTLLLKDILAQKGVVFWYTEEKLDCKIGIRLFYFGSSSSHSKIYAALIKDNGERLLIGADLKREQHENLVFNFIRFFDDETIICFYEKVFPNIVNAVYRYNYQIPSNRVKFFK